MSTRFDHVTNKRAIIDRRALADALDGVAGEGTALRLAATAILKPALDAGRREISARLTTHPSRGAEIAAAQAYLIDQILRLAYDFTTQRLHPIGNPTASERLTLIGVGGYGRGEMAPFSDVDIGFLTPWKPTGWTEQVIESMLYTLWESMIPASARGASAFSRNTIPIGKAISAPSMFLLPPRFSFMHSCYDDHQACRVSR